MAFTLVTFAQADKDLVWLRRRGYNCTGAEDNLAVPGKSPLGGHVTSLSCMNECEREPLCSAIMVSPEHDPGPCWLQKSVKLSLCPHDKEADLWERAPESPDPPVGIWTSFGQHTACRLSSEDSTENGKSSAMVYGARTLEACKGLCGLADNCYGIEFEAVVNRCEVWTQPIGFIVPVEGYECLSFQQDFFV